MTPTSRSTLTVKDGKATSRRRPTCPRGWFADERDVPLAPEQRGDRRDRRATSKGIKLEGTGYKAELKGSPSRSPSVSRTRWCTRSRRQLSVQIPGDSKNTVLAARDGRQGPARPGRGADIQSFRPPEPYKGKGVRSGDDGSADGEPGAGQDPPEGGQGGQGRQGRQVTDLVAEGAVRLRTRGRGHDEQATGRTSGSGARRASAQGGSTARRSVRG
jgi:hypothetical protein